MSPPSTPDPGASAKRVRGSGCPLCGRPVAPEHHPFCSRGCRDRDLLAWLGDGYRLPGRAVDPGSLENDADGLDSGADGPL